MASYVVLRSIPAILAVVKASPFFTLVYDREVKIYENRNRFPRFFFVTEHSVAPTAESAFSDVARRSREELRRSVILETTPPPFPLPRRNAERRSARPDFFLTSRRATR